MGEIVGCCFYTRKRSKLIRISPSLILLIVLNVVIEKFPIESAYHCL